jgi:hypothetical protein
MLGERGRMIEDRYEWKKKYPIVEATIEPIHLDGDYTNVPSVSATCEQCGHTTESYGRGEESVRRSLAVLRKECPLRKTNWYTDIVGQA